ncbi:MAG: protein kinase [Candidatus Schekmanbacteria bacterium]|nr:protein kinase [Candidatus Schekmanbacteria bacterium]
MSPAPGPRRLGGYALAEPLGEGGMGTVYRAVEESSGRIVALKTVRVMSELGLAGLRREIRALARLRHPGIVRILADGVEDGAPWYAMEAVTGTSLRAVFREDGAGAPATSSAVSSAPTSWWTAHPAVTEVTTRRRPRVAPEEERPYPPAAEASPRPHGAAGLRQVLTCFRRLCSPLAYLHGEGLVHRDIKPDNILLRPDGAPVIVDFGLAAQFGGASGREVLAPGGQTEGTISYMSPEQISGDFVDARADLYALGCMLYEAVTGQVPFVSGSAYEVLQRHLRERPAPPSSLASGVPGILDALILALLEKSPRNRVGHAADVAAVLADLGAENGFAASAPPPRSYLYRPALSGRAAELGQLAARIAALEDGTGAVVLIAGESGVGKTRLAMEATRHAGRRQIPVLIGECLADDPRSLRGLHRPLLAVADYCREGGMRETARVLGRRGKILEAVIPALGTVPGQAELPEAAPLPGPAAEQRLFTAAWEALVAYGEDEPLILVIDDLQWADDLTLKAVRSFADRIGRREGAVLVAGTYRADEAGDELRALAAAPNVSCLRLGGLAPEAVGVIVADMLAADRPDEGIVAFARHHGEGNPFFLAEYLRGAVEAGLLARSAEGRWRLAPEVTAAAAADALAQLALPTTIRAVVEQRLGRLPAAARAMAQAAAAVGREVGGDLLAELCGTTLEEAAEQQQELLRRQIFEAAGDGEALRFLHDKLREVAYDLVAAGERPGLHRRVAVAMAARKAAGESVAEGELGRHWELAGERDSAAACYLAGAREAEKRHAAALAEELYRRYLAVVDAGSEASIEARLELVNRVLIPHSRPREALEVLEPAAAAARGSGRPRLEARVRVGEAGALFLLGRLDEAEAAAARGLEITGQPHDDELAAQVFRLLGVVRYARADSREAEKYLTSALRIFRRLKHGRGLAITVSNLAAVLHFRDSGRAMTLNRRATKLSAAIGDKTGEAISLGNQASLLMNLGRAAEARACLERALAINTEIGHEAAIARLRASRANLAMSDGDLALADALFRESIRELSDMGLPHLLAAALTNAGSVQAALGAVNDARRTLNQAIELCRKIEDREYLVHAIYHLCRLECRTQADTTVAEEYAVQCVAAAELAGQPVAMALSQCALAHVALASGRSASRLLEAADRHLASVGFKEGSRAIFTEDVVALKAAQRAFDEGVALFRGELLRTIPEGLQAWLRRNGHLPADREREVQGGT